jgi:ring-1,2-phenylacetyl-CoA epoxidase subunit PaaD
VVSAVARPAAEAAVWAALAEVPDPEIPALSLVDLGVVNRVELDADGDAIRVELLPTFVGCPAIEQMRAAAAERLAGLARKVDVEVTLAEPWTSDRITDEGRRKLRVSGFAPPARGGPRQAPLIETIALRPGLRGGGPGTGSGTGSGAEAVACPWCGSRATELENPFGPTLCRAIHWCRSCRQSFERFKRV